MKKIIALTAAVLLLAGCAGTEGNAPVAADPAAETTEEIKEEIFPENETVTETVTEEPEEEVPVLRDAVRANSGDFVGCAVTGAEIDDPKVWDIITTHFERVTLGNELKPDCMFGYSVAQCPGTETDTLNGEDITVPKLDHSRADRMLDRFLKWNEENPDRKIMIRGHVLVWHSQTPEWFFHEEYDKNKPYVSAAEMDKRLEWYIKSMLSYYTGEGSRYKGLFYGWDVVNEAVSDGSGTYRTEAENPSEPLSDDRHGSNSSWWAVYRSEQYIINAFKYANKYAPAELELYYNDYNECVRNKKYGIIELLKAIKAQEGASGEGTRISAMGMQGHYGMTDPSTIDIQSAIKQYAEVVGKVQLTEVDIRASEDYDGSEAAKPAEYEKLEKRYNVIWNCVKSADAEVEGITFWGTVDHYSWLQSRSDVGGGSKTGLPQCPLLFDENYEPKPCFYTFTK
ncbi:MAG: endo-1,4-beta-xylanase [Lachnospiraceae bacterium]|nr:endo-1,4-beta-xylanase [Lachnospiraceae bacterium]